jgi:hypothetical protein
MSFFIAHGFKFNVIELFGLREPFMEVVGEIAWLGAVIAERTFQFLVACAMEESGATIPAVNEVESRSLNFLLVALLGLTFVLA